MRKHLCLFALSPLLIALFAFGSCRKIAKNEAYYAAVSKYVYAYTSGSIGRNDAIRVRFVNPAVGTDRIGQKVEAGLFSVSPSIPGDAVWEDDRTIKLQPAESLPYGEKYTGTVALGKLFSDVPKEAKTFEFDFSIRELSYEVNLVGLRTENPNDLRRQQLAGRILTSDPVDNSAAEKMLRARQGNKTLSVGWVHSGEGRTHDFYVNDVERGNVRSSVQLDWSGDPIGVDKDGSPGNWKRCGSSTGMPCTWHQTQ